MGTGQQLSDKANKKEVEQHKAKKPKDLTEAEKPTTTVVTRAAGRKGLNYYSHLISSRIIVLIMCSQRFSNTHKSCKKERYAYTAHTGLA